MGEKERPKQRGKASEGSGNDGSKDKDKDAGCGVPLAEGRRAAIIARHKDLLTSTRL
jgi:hypothetical protein